MRAARPTLCFAAGIIFSSSFVPACAQGIKDSQEPTIPRGLHPPVSVNAEPVSVQFGSSRYEIPRDYLVSVTPARDVNSYAAFTIRVLIPDFTPRTIENASQFDVAGWHNKFSALFEYGRHPTRSPEEVLDFYLKNAGLSKDDFRSVGSGYKLYENAKTWPTEIYTKQTASGLLFFVCGTKKNGTPFPSCTVNETFEENVGVIYHFSRDYLDQTSEFDLKLHDLLRSFKKSGAEPPAKISN